MQVRERLIKEIQDMPPEDLLNVYEHVLDLKKRKRTETIGKKRTYLEVQQSLESCSGCLSEDITRMREDRI